MMMINIHNYLSRVIKVGILVTSVYIVCYHFEFASTGLNVEAISRILGSKTQQDMAGAVSTGQNYLAKHTRHPYYVSNTFTTQVNELSQQVNGTTTSKASFSSEEYDADSKDKKAVNKSYKILWYNPPSELKNRPEGLYGGFSQCHFSNCEMSFNTSERMNSDAVLFDGRFMLTSDIFDRPHGQVWIFSAHEAPSNYDLGRGDQWRKAPWLHAYNWTMTYNKFNTDIYLPYGTLRRKKFQDKRNYTYIASKKNDSVLMVSSHCQTSSKRQEYVAELSKYIPVTVLGACGTLWKCGERYVHDDCFDLLNTTYKFYLAFENALCTQYFTEKFFENFNYDIIMVVRGGNKTEEKRIFPNGTYISAHEFNSAKDLGMYLKILSDSNTEYAKMLKTKSMYFSPAYKEVYQNAMCELCKRMNFQMKYHQRIPNIEEWAFKNNPCGGS